MTDKTNHAETMDMLATATEERAASSTELLALGERVTSVEEALDSNTKLTKAAGEDTRELGEGLKWLGIVATAVAAIWAATHSGKGS